MDRRDHVTQNVAVPVAVGVFANVVFLLCAFAVSTAVALPALALVPAAAVFVVLVVLVAWRPARRRVVTMHVLQEVSSSRCGDYFVRLASLTFAEIRAPKDALERLAGVAQVRRYPNRRFLEDLQEVVAPEADVASARATTKRYLDGVPDARALARAQVLDAAAQFLSMLQPDAHLVLYGYSNTVCEGLARFAGRLELPVFLVEDRQYGVEGSLGEHVYARRHLEGCGIRPILLPFDQIAALRSPNADFVRTASGDSVPLPSRRRVVALLGCEAVDVSGEVLIPSRRSGAPSETAKFVEVFQQSEHSGPGTADVVVVSESYKTYDALGAAWSHAPLKASRLRWALYLVGLRPPPRATQVELVRLPFHSLHAIIDDAGVHRPPDSSGMHASRRLWRERAVARIGPGNAPVGLEQLLTSARVAVFDLNGVLMDDEPAHFAAFGDMLRGLDASLSYDEYVRHCSGRTDQEGVQRLAAAKGLAADESALLRAKRDAYERHRGEFPLLSFPGAIEVARDLSRLGVECFLITSSDEATATAFLEGCGLDEIFGAERRFFAVESARRPAVLKAILERARVPPHACVVFDDTPGNLAAASKLGVGTVAVATTHPAESLSASVVVNGPLQLSRHRAEL